VAPSDSRPTADRVREALFSALGAQGAIEGAVVLDLFAGSGALAIEALSRGAARAVLIDRDREAQAACEQNLETTGFGDRAKFVRSVIGGRHGEPEPGGPFDLVFCDPPYSLPDAEVALVLDGLLDWKDMCLTDRALVVVERPGPAWSAPRGWTTTWERRYGDTLVTVVHATDVAL